MLFLRGFILKPTERGLVLLKNGIKNFQIAFHLRNRRVFMLQSNQWKFWTFSIL